MMWTGRLQTLPAFLQVDGLDVFLAQSLQPLSSMTTDGCVSSALSTEFPTNTWHSEHQ